ncbi:MAG TPA: hypothetical protein VJZ25_04715, partial [Gemmatimonadaceae bacterium]|nr:hypothetical protein [Gemmatimonadaceae bacterium]
RLLGSEAPGASSVTVTTNSNPIAPESPTSGGGFAPVNWTMPTNPGTYTLTATSSITGGSVAFTATVPEPTLSLTALGGAWVNENQETGWNTGVSIDVEGNAASVEAWGQCSAWDCQWGPTDAATTAWTSDQQITAVWDQGFVTRTQTITYLSASRLQVVLFSDYTEADGRADVTVTEFFERPALNLLSRLWDNQNLETPGITRVAIGVDGPAVTVQAWGKCSPTDCDWGNAETVNTSAWAGSQQITAFWNQTYATRTQTITFLSVDFIKVVTFTDFTEADGRTDYTLVEYFKVNT